MNGKGWVLKSAVMEATKSLPLRGWIESQPYKNSIPCIVQPGKKTTRLIKENEMAVEIMPTWGKCVLVVPREAVDIEVHLKSVSIPYNLYLEVSRYVGLGKCIGDKRGG
ncbi:hypothetical protein HYS94_01755 [Candidatus Daviesbacteria bacterium]|nr:hypothetical protein [Candidatus Daviesbacteria bacterium]